MPASAHKRTADTISRRRAVAALGALAVSVVAAACTPLRIVLRLYPEEFHNDPQLVRRVLAGFADAVVPAEPEDAWNTAAVYADPRFPLAEYAPFLASDLTRRAYASSRREAFECLPRPERVAIIQTALDAGGVTTRLYAGAVFLTQIAFYAGLCREDGACPAIDFEGPYEFRGFAALTHPHPERFLPFAATANGNPS